MRQFLFISLVLCMPFITMAQQTKSAILWNEKRPLNWTDFKARPNSSSAFVALTVASISFSVDYDGSTISILTENSFDPKGSWSKNKNNNALLSHEQLHFNISELYARKLRKVLLEKTFKSDGDRLIKEVVAVYEQKIKELAKFQQRYDKETDHSVNETEQLEWEKLIAKELKLLQNYTDPLITIQLDRQAN